jgi:hypothetical protein
VCYDDRVRATNTVADAQHPPVADPRSVSQITRMSLATETRTVFKIHFVSPDCPEGNPVRAE